MKQGLILTGVLWVMSEELNQSENIKTNMKKLGINDRKIDRQVVQDVCFPLYRCMKQEPIMLCVIYVQYSK